MPSLYSDFSLQKDINPDGYEINVAAWQKALSRAALAGRLPGKDGPDVTTLHANNGLLAELETREYGRPLALHCVIVWKGSLVISAMGRRTASGSMRFVC